MNNISLTKKLVQFTLINISIIAFDQLTKLWAVKSLKGLPPINYLGGFIKLIYAENTGAWGNLGGDWPDLARTAFLIILPLVVLLGISIYSFKSIKMKNYERIAYHFVIAGGIGNLIDRIYLGYVVDFMWFGLEKLGTNIFNIADVSIMIGFFMLVILGFIDSRNEKRTN